MKAVLIVAAVVLVVVAVTRAQLIERSVAVESVAYAIPPVPVPSLLDQSQEAGPEVKLVLLALRPEGFESNEMQLDPGEHLFIIGNRTALKEVNIRLECEGSGRIAEAVVGGRQRDWKKRLRLTPGTYLLTANNNPDWTCRIVVGQ